MRVTIKDSERLSGQQEVEKRLKRRREHLLKVQDGTVTFYGLLLSKDSRYRPTGTVNFHIKRSRKRLAIKSHGNKTWISKFSPRRWGFVDSPRSAFAHDKFPYNFAVGWEKEGEGNASDIYYRPSLKAYRSR